MSIRLQSIDRTFLDYRKLSTNLLALIEQKTDRSGTAAILSNQSLSKAANSLKRGRAKNRQRVQITGLYSMRADKDALLFMVANVAYNLGFTPNILTALGLSFGVLSGVLFAVRAVPFAFAFGFFSVSCDVLDGTLARTFQLETKFGLVFDSAADRVSEFAVVLGALACGIIQPFGLIALVGSTVLLAMRTVSYNQGLKTDYVLFGRFERLLFILAGLLVQMPAVSTVCFVVAGGFGLVSSCQIAISLRRQRSIDLQEQLETSSFKTRA